MPLPTFIVVGAVKAGTTSLFNYLGQHPDIQMSEWNWPRYFHVCDGPPDFDAMSRQYGSALRNESEKHFAKMCPERVPRTLHNYAALWNDKSDAKERGEVSPTYLHDASVCDRIARQLPRAKLIMVLRNPVDRAYSHFVMDRRRNWESVADFGEALDREPVDIDEFWWGRRQYVRHGMYADTIARFQAAFPNEQLKVMLYDDLAADSSAYLGEMLDFIGVDSSFEIDTSTRHHKGMVKEDNLKSRLLYAAFPGKQLIKRSLPTRLRNRISGSIENATHAEPDPLTDDVRERLQQVFREDIQKTQALIGRDLSVWLA